MKKRTFATLLALATAMHTWAGLTLAECREAARQNYPAIRQYGLVAQSRDYTLSAAIKGWMPQVSVSATAMAFTDIANLPAQAAPIVGSASNTLYGATLQVTQPIYDGGAISAKRHTARMESEADMRRVDVSLYAIRERTDQLFFGVLATDERLRQNHLLQQDLSISLDAIGSMVRHGVANQSDMDAARVELLKVRQQECGLAAQRKAFLLMLATFTGKTLTDSVRLEMPHELIANATDNNRPELDLYQAQSQLADSKRKALDTQLRPKLSLFGLASYHNKVFGLMKNANLAAGITLKWNIGALYTRREDLRAIELQRQDINVRRETFLLNTSLQSQQVSGTINGLHKQIALDDDIITLHNGIKEATERKVGNGTETVSELLRAINAVGEARQAKAMHQLQLLQETYRQQTITNHTH